jgi:hypothetical protein
MAMCEWTGKMTPSAKSTGKFSHDGLRMNATGVNATRA